MKYKLKVFSIWEAGQRKDSLGNAHQEDCLFPAQERQSDTDRLFILCDGMGGHDSGEVASATVCKAMSESILHDGHDSEGVFTSADFDAALASAFRALDSFDTGSQKKMGTTMTMLKLHDGGAFVAHMGDSRVYHIRPGKDGDSTQILYQTLDHSLVNDLLKIDEITPEEARHSPKKNIITRAMQPHMEHQPKAETKNITDIRPGDYFYLCSDGMLEKSDMDDGTSLRNVFSDLGGDDAHKVEILRSVTEENSDNHSAFIIHITEVAGDASRDTVTARPDALSRPAADIHPSPAPPRHKKKLTIKRPSRRDTVRKPAAENAQPSVWAKVTRFVIAAAVTAGIIICINCFSSAPSAEATPDAASTPMPVPAGHIKPRQEQAPRKSRPSRQRRSATGASSASDAHSAHPGSTTTPPVSHSETAADHSSFEAAASRMTGKQEQNEHDIIIDSDEQQGWVSPARKKSTATSRKD